MLNYPVFIVGSPRSGTSILVQAMLGAGFTGHHEGNLLSLLQGLERGIDNHFRIFGSENPLVLTSHIKAPALKAAVFSSVRDIIDAHHAGQVWFDKTGNPEMIEVIPILRMLWPASRFIFAKRRGIENITSRLTKFPSLSFEYHCADWARNMLSWRRIREAMPDLIAVEIDQYDIAQSPEAAAAALAAFIEVPLAVQEQIQEIFERDRPQETSEGSARRTLSLAATGWTPQQLEIFHKHCAAPMAAYRYTEDDRYYSSADAGISLYLRGGPAPPPPAPEPDPHEISTLLAKLDDPDISLEQLLKFYIDYQGRLYPGQVARFRQKVERLTADSDVYIDIAAATSPRAKLGLQILSRGIDGFGDRNFYPAGTAEFTRTEILPASPNEFHDPSLLPAALRFRLNMPERPAFLAFTRARGKLFVGPHQYQYFSEKDGVYYPDASSRQFSKTIASNPELKFSGHVVLIQDPGSGDNFSHFAYDWATRIMHAMNCGLADKAGTLFVMGGERGAFQDAIVAALSAIHGFTPENFFFPTSRVVLEVDGVFSFFSDQRIASMHPAQMAHPASMEFLRQLAEHIPGPKGNTERLFISRGDTHFRRISNQAELSAIAATRGYKTVELAKLPMAEQFTLFRNAKRVIGAHGMGFSHLMFSERQPSILELFHPTMGTDAYALLAKAWGLDYRQLIGTADAGDAENRSSYQIDPDQFARMLDEML